jgi:alpha-ketoglutarate-dependent taurine dioxygenase
VNGGIVERSSVAQRSGGDSSFLKTPPSYGSYPLHGTFGAEVIGTPATLELDDGSYHAIEQEWLRHSIPRFRDPRMTAKQHVAFTRLLDPFHIMKPLSMNVPVHPEVLVVSNAISPSPPDSCHFVR